MGKRLFSSFKLGRIELKNRVVMAPLTRSRASAGGVPNDLMALYYRQRASAGLIVTEGTSPSPNGLGYARIPGLYSVEQVRGWKAVTDGVHRDGGHIFAQLMHTGRVTHVANLPPGAKVLAPSAIAMNGKIHTDVSGEQPYSPPKEMTEAEIEQTIAEYVHASRLAIEAGLDGVELHGANGYLIDQFLNTASNHRLDRWGGRTVEDRSRFALTIAQKVGEAIGFDRVGIRVSPYGAFNDMVADNQTDALYIHLAKELSKIGIAYIHVVDHSSMGAPPLQNGIKEKIRENFKGTFILSGGYDAARAEADLSEGKGDLVAFGRPFISNPDLVEKLRDGKPQTAPDFATFYTPGAKGYTDYK